MMDDTIRDEIRGIIREEVIDKLNVYVEEEEDAFTIDITYSGETICSKRVNFYGMLRDCNRDRHSH